LEGEKEDREGLKEKKKKKKKRREEGEYMRFCLMISVISMTMTAMTPLFDKIGLLMLVSKGLALIRATQKKKVPGGQLANHIKHNESDWQKKPKRAHSRRAKK
jgi:hypothetical protein